jgi:hypothetical protein
LQPHEVNGVSRTLRFDMGAQPVLWPSLGQTPDLYFIDHWPVAPRFGFAYRIHQTWVIRGGYGIFNMAGHFNQMNTLQINPPNASIQATSPNLNPVATIQNPFPLALVPANPIFDVTSVELDRTT